MTSEKRALVAFGSNLELGGIPPKTILTRAISQLEAMGISVESLSRLYKTPCFPVGAGPDYVNAAAVVTLRHNDTADGVLAALHRVEADFGRERVSRWAGRTLDIDLLALGNLVLPDVIGFRHWQGLAPEEQARLAPDQLILPHPRMAERAFVLVPLSDVAPDWRHPVLGLTVTQMLTALPAADREAVQPLAPDASV